MCAAGNIAILVECFLRPQRGKSINVLKTSRVQFDNF